MSVRSAWNTLVAVTIYCAAYLAASSLDLWTTHLALSLTTASEGNVFVVDDGGYDADSAWILTWIAGVLLTALFTFGVITSDRISEHWLRHPLRSFLSLRSNPFFAIPWSKHVIDRSPLHAISAAVAFVVLRLFAAVNNAMIATGHTGPLGTAIDGVARNTSPLVGFVVVIAGTYAVLVLAVSIAAAKLIAKRRLSGETNATPN